MAQSFVPQGTSVICTMMTCGSPQEIGITRNAYNIHTEKGQPLLNINDKKLSAEFGCKTTKKFWGGLKALCIGIAIAAAVVLTGGAAIAVVAIAFTAAVIATGVSIYKTAHACDVISSYEWVFFHETVYIEGASALLNSSQLSCAEGGGLINIIMKPEIAQDAAKYISNNNNKEILAQEGSMLAMGFIGVYSAAVMAPAALGAVSSAAAVSAVTVSATVAVAMYAPGEWMGDKISNEGGANVASNVSGDLVGTAVTAGESGVLKDVAVGTVKNTANKSIPTMARGLAQYGAGNVMDNIGKSLEGAVRYAVGKTKFNFSIDTPSLGGMLCNILIGTASDNYENDLAKDTIYMSGEFDKQDRNRGINVIALTK
ncbi:DUF4280 domain-containing protein [Flavobacterium zhairuonense]|uniref:PAAR-like protein n=1 Tax=Flavobacterium zhairuonense TaxID=2493631 RepID=UPI00104394EB|nr:PAAR-like protein [Flavobacterium zhairuonense]KAF2507622.1 DUF4280 domain-containing protein [Flavobacterium zhairuonense]